MARAAAQIELRPNPPTGATLIRIFPSGRRRARALGPRALLSLAEAAAVLKRPRAEVQRAVRTKFLRSARGGRYVTYGACLAFLREEAADGRAAQAAMASGGPSIPARELYRRLGI